VNLTLIRRVDTNLGLAGRVLPVREATMVTIAFLLSMVAIPTVCDGTQLLPMTLQSVASRAKIAFAGTVDSIAYDAIDGQVVTRVHFRDVRFARGLGQGQEITVTLHGGIMNGEEIEVDGMPQFETSRRYSVLAADTGTKANSYMPIIGLNQGVFRIQPDPSSHRTVVHDLGGRPLVQINGKHIAVVYATSGTGRIPPKGRKVRKVYGMGLNGLDREEPAIEIYPQELDPGTRVTEEEFLRAVELLSKNGK
jgi:hypothetical protein